MQKRAFQALKRPFMHVSGLLLSYFLFKRKTIYKINSFLSKYGRGRPKTCINVRFRPLSARLCMSQALRHQNLIENQILYKLVFKSKYGGGRPETCISVRLRTWNSRFCVSQVFPSIKCFFNKNMAGKT